MVKEGAELGTGLESVRSRLMVMQNQLNDMRRVIDEASRIRQREHEFVAERANKCDDAYLEKKRKTGV